MSNQTKQPAYGGQAVVEGVMFGGRRHYVTAIRRKDGSIEFFKLPRKTNPTLEKLKKIPFLRGIIAIVEASANGTKHLNFSSERYDLDPSLDDQLKEEKPSNLTMIFGLAAVGVLSFVRQVYFTLVPVFSGAHPSGLSVGRRADYDRKLL